MRELAFARGCWLRRTWGVAALTLLLGATPVRADQFDDELARVDRALQENPGQVVGPALDSCVARRNAAIRLHESGQQARALRSLEYCLQILHVPEQARKAEAAWSGPSIEEIQARAAREIERALALAPDVGRGLEIYRECALCHMPEGWGLPGGTVPQIAGQHRTVVIKQLADIRAGNRDNVMMAPYASAESIGGVQAVADVAGYIDTLEMSVATKKGPGEHLALGEGLYQEHCARCHGAAGEGNAESFVPRIQAQHYSYLVRQFQAIRDGKRRNANPEMTAQIRDFGDRETQAVLDYVSRLEPPEDLRAPPGWHNPDFVE